MTRAILLVCLLCPLLRAQVTPTALPELSADRAAALTFPIDPESGLTQDNHYAQLIAHVGTWGNLMPRWNAQPDRRPDLLGVDRFRTLGSVIFAEPGEPFVFSARFIRKAPLEGRPNIERWVVTPFDEETGERAATPVVVFVDRRITGQIQEPVSGFYVLIASRAYRQTFVESVRGNVLPTHSFVGAVFYTGSTAQGDLSDTIAWIGIAVATVFAIGFVVFIVIVVQVKRSKDGGEEPGAA
ncbi:MAG: hypothetical protein AAGH64_11405 [Planctomycetota bacterium]